MHSKLTFVDNVGSPKFLSTNFPSLQNDNLARGRSKPGSVHLQRRSLPIFSVTSNVAIPPSMTSSSPTRMPVKCNNYIVNKLFLKVILWTTNKQLMFIFRPSENLSKFTCIVNGRTLSVFLLVNAHSEQSCGTIKERKDIRISVFNERQGIED